MLTPDSMRNYRGCAKARLGRGVSLTAKSELASRLSLRLINTYRSAPALSPGLPQTVKRPTRCRD